MLTKTIKCLHCGEELELEENERTAEFIKCPSCGKDNQASKLLIVTEEAYSTQYPMLRNYSRGVKFWGFVVGGIFLYLFIEAATAIPDKYETGLIIAGIFVAISIVIFYWLISEAIKAYADIADNSHRTVTLLQALSKRRSP